MLQLSAQSPRPLGLGQLRKRTHTVVISCKRWSGRLGLLPIMRT